MTAAPRNFMPDKPLLGSAGAMVAYLLIALAILAAIAAVVHDAVGLIYAASSS
jgi:hypothetical protein